MAKIRAPAVAGLFYPDDPDELRGQLRHLLAGAALHNDTPPKALIVPHAGYVYSGPVAATAYRRLAGHADRYRKVVLLGPSHRVAFNGMAVTSATSYRTPLGMVPIDAKLVENARQQPGVELMDAAHELEHSLEVQLPFLQTVLQAFTLLPVVVGNADVDKVAGLLNAVWGQSETLIVISTDLSHYLSYDNARRIDAETSRAVERADVEAIGPGEACGCFPLRGLLELVRRNQLLIETLDLRNSGDTAGPRDRVVGYGSYAVYEPD